MRYQTEKSGQIIPEDPRIRALGAALFFCVLQSVFAGGLVLAMRLPMGPSDIGIGFDDILRAAGISAAIMALMTLGLVRGLTGWMTAAIPLIGGAVILWAGAQVPLAGDALLVLLIVALAATSAKDRMRIAPRLGGMAWIVALAALLAVAQVSVLVRLDAASPLAFERALAGVQHVDTLFHASLAGIEGQYGVVSIGLDGLVPLQYHTFSHSVFQHFAEWSGLPSLMAYSVFSPVVCFPVMIFALLAACATGPLATWQKADPVVAIVTMVMIVMMVSLGTLLSFWASESAMVAQWFMLLALIVVGLAARDGTRWQDVPTALLLALLVFLAATSKISSGAILGAGLGIWYLLMSGLRLRGFVYAALVTALPFLFVFLSTFAGHVTSRAAGFGMFGFLYVYGFAPLLIIVIGAQAYALRRMFRTDGALSGPEAAFRWMIVAMLGLSVTAGAILRLPGVAELYFVGPGIWACLSYFMRDGRIGQFMGQRSFNLRMAAVTALAVVPLLGKGTLPKGARITQDGYAKMETFAKPVTTEGLLSATTLGQIYQAVTADPTIDAITVGPEVAQVWQGRDPCWVASLAVPALTGRAMIAGLPPAQENCKLTPFYGFVSYDPALSSAQTLPPDAQCEKAASAGFSRVLQVQADRMDVITCEALQR